MQINNLQRATGRKFSRQHGRGGKRGKTAGRGTKGQNARAGRKFRPEMRDAIKKLPKLRGYRFNSAIIKPVAINLLQLAQFTKGEVVSPKTLVEKKVVDMVLGKIPRIKILATGEISSALTFENISVSKEAIAKIEKAGGSVTLPKVAPKKERKEKVVVEAPAKKAKKK